jgi:hypothetical protein
MNKSYLQFVQDLRQNIIQSRYIAARLANREQLLLYVRVGKMLSEKIAAEKCDTNLFEQIAAGLQREYPGLRGFSVRNLRDMYQFYHVYEGTSIGQALTAQLEKSATVPDQQLTDAFFGISFTHHLLLMNKCQSEQERRFYMQQAATQYWSAPKLEHHISADLYHTRR